MPDADFVIDCPMPQIGGKGTVHVGNTIPVSCLCVGVCRRDTGTGMPARALLWKTKVEEDKQ